MWLGWVVMITPGIKLISQQPKPCHANHPTGPLQVLLLKGLALSHPAPPDTCENRCTAPWVCEKGVALKCGGP